MFQAKKSEEKGYLCLVLHAHLPFVRHPEHEDFLEEDWLYEALTETYVPLVGVFDKLINDGVDFRLTFSISPTLAAMFSDPLLQQRYLHHLYKLIELTDKEQVRVKNHPEFHEAARMYYDKLRETRFIFEEKYNGNLLNAFRKFQDLGKIEVITSCATHGFLPLMISRRAVRAQVRIAVRDYQLKFGRRPKGIWLSECAYNPGDDEILKEEELRFFFLDTHGIIYGTPRPRYAVFAPVYCPSGVAAFGRDVESSLQVWSSETGYPGDFRYREFYRDVGYDLDYDYIRPYLHSDGIRRNVGIKYYKITGKVGLGEKEPYRPKEGLEVAAEHAGNFMFNREKQVEYLYDFMGRKPIIVAPYDAELFGHWWYEGPDFLNFLFRKIYYDQTTLRPINPSEYLNENPRNQVITPSMSSWGDKGYNEVWLNGNNDWIYRHLHKATERMLEIAEGNPQARGLKRRALNQAARELLLAQASDWAFIMTTGRMVEYAEKRTRNHIHHFNRLYEEIKNNGIDENHLNDLEYRDNVFPEMDYRAYL